MIVFTANCLQRCPNAEVRNLVASILHTKEVYRNKGVFDWLRGDTGMRLRVDAYFTEHKLVVEYHGKQHFKPSNFMDRRPGRAEQRRRYTVLRRKLIPRHGLKLLEIRYDEPLTKEYITKKLKEMGLTYK